MDKKQKREKFTAIEKHADTPTGTIDAMQWEGESVQVESDTKLEQDTGTGMPIVVRKFSFGINPAAFKTHKPTKQELFDSGLRAMEVELWKDGLKPFEGVEPRLFFSKNRRYYHIVIGCVPTRGNVLIDAPHTLSQLLNATK